MWSVLAIIIPLLLLVVLIWKKVNIAVSAILCTGLMAFMSSLNVYDSLTVNYMEAFVGYIESYWPLVFLGASFGKAMQLGGGAEDLANLLTSKLNQIYHCRTLRHHPGTGIRRRFLLCYRICYLSHCTEYV